VLFHLQHRDNNIGHEQAQKQHTVPAVKASGRIGKAVFDCNPIEDGGMTVNSASEKRISPPRCTYLSEENIFAICAL
jgi:hypothetical protein